MIPTTDEMDKVTPEERAALIGQCASCSEWIQFTKGDTITHCNEPLDMRTIHSQRTFNPVKIKKRRTRR